LASLTQLTELDLDSNQISEIGPLANLVQLRSLNLFANQVTDLSPLLALSHLENIYVGQNPIVCDVQTTILQTLAQRGVKIGRTNCGAY
jgi:internalin A